LPKEHIDEMVEAAEMLKMFKLEMQRHEMTSTPIFIILRIVLSNILLKNSIATKAEGAPWC